MLDTCAGRYDWTRDANARRVLREAVGAGAREVVLFSISAPVSMTKNGHAYGTKHEDKRASNLALERHGDYAKYLDEITEHFLRAKKLSITALSPLNEPE